MLFLLFAIILLAGGTTAFFYLAPQIGGEADGARLDRMVASKNNKEGKFQNPVETTLGAPTAHAFIKFLQKGVERTPDSTITTVPFNKALFEGTDTNQLLLSWFGHSSMLLRIDGKNLLIDPVFGERASMFTFMGPKRYDYSQHVTVDDMPRIDAVIISHDHYDHLDYETIIQLKDKVSQYFLPLGVGAHLASWGIPEAHMKELDWWEEIEVNKDIRLAFTPSRHFSGRAFRDRFNTLWGSWVIMGANRRIFYSGDSGYFEGFKEIGKKYGPFDFAMMECGQYYKDWASIHMMPEETAQAAVDVQAKVAMPVHWGKFTLSLHPWKEPVQRFLTEAKRLGLETTTPLAGEVVVISEQMTQRNWWD